MTMDGQRTGSAKKYLPYHNTLILHKSKNLTVKDQLNKIGASLRPLSLATTPNHKQKEKENEKGHFFGGSRKWMKLIISKIRE